ncbi:hypothetical protein AAG598_07900 [Citromicrobium bathyomarinum]
MAKATLGYPSRSAAVRAMVASGKNEREIATELGIYPAEVRVCLRYVRRASVPVSWATLVGLKIAANRYGSSPKALAERLLERIVADDLVDAVLDEAGGNDG